MLEALFAAEGPVSADYIAGGLGGRGPEVDLASVYRNLEQLEELGVVRHVQSATARGCTRSRRRRARVPGLRALRPGDRRSTPAQLDEVRGARRADFGYRARFTHFPITGLCPACAAAGDAPAARASTPTSTATATTSTRTRHVHAHGPGHAH